MRIPVDFFLEETLDRDREPPFYSLSKHKANARTQGLMGKKDKNNINFRYSKLIPARKK